MKNVEREYTEEELRVIDNDIAEALLSAAAYRTPGNDRREISIKRGDKILFKFIIEGINEDIWRKCRKQNTRNRNKSNEELDTSRFLAQAIYEATIEEDKERVWKNKEVWKKLNVASGTDVVNAVLTPGEKARIGELLEELGGYGDDLDGLIKNV